ncbi:electron transport complex subunit RsxC [Alloalcanivorax xenomutans]|uniref:electron transport complex subunit RsxC n=1 Tax=Alloalcanivorax xenomutans TaxID=1094342 RepID=UPI0024E20885|nr:electron transport complex subunit RsxC [Alloalcanivorax xenomutans]WOA30004.1 electron transport complex subunit RsxC [Alloalcanivorax xenomutans]
MLARLFRGGTREIFDFPGGIHPPEHKSESNTTPILPGPLPSQLILPLNMHIGAPARPLVQVGDKVLKGQHLAEGNGAVSAPVHAPTSGTVVAIGPRPIQHPSGMDAPCLVLEPDGEDRWGDRAPLDDPFALSPGELLERIAEAGIVGLGGAGFPTSVKVSLGDHQRVRELIVNGVECEPFITADDRLMRERAADIVQGIQVLQYLLNPERTLLGIEDNKPEAAAALRAAAVGADIDVRVVPTKYPSGGEKQLIQLLTGKEVGSGGLPIQVGVVCQNVGTAYALKRALFDGEPLISRITTVTGDAVARPGNYEILLGTPVAELLQHAGVDKTRLQRLVLGGPMMGFTLHNPAIPLVKTSNCLIAASTDLLPEPEPEQACIRCGACADACPASLLPQQLYWYAKNDDLERAQQQNLMDCIECGACAYVCPSHIPLVQYYRYAKGEIRIQAAERAKADRARERFEARQARVEKEQAEKEARRRARQQANRAPAAAGDNAAALKQASLDASKAYKAAVKAAKEAENRGDPDLTRYQAEVEKRKTAADQAKAAVRDAGKAAPPSTDTHPKAEADLKKQVADASAAYKNALREAKAALAEEREDAATLQSRAETLKAEADRLKAALRDARAGQPASAPTAAPDPVEALKKAVAEASSAYKAAVKATKEAEQNEADDAARLRAEADRLKAKADELKQQLRDAKAAAPATPKAAPSPAAAAAPTTTEPAGAGGQASASDEEAAKQQKRLNALKTAYKMAHKQYKEAHSALDRARRDGAVDLAAMEARVEKLKSKADHTRDALDALMDETKASLLAHTGKDLKTLKLDAARAETALRDKSDELKRLRDTADEDTLKRLTSELGTLEHDAHLARRALKQALEEHGLTEE